MVIDFSHGGLRKDGNNFKMNKQLDRVGLTWSMALWYKNKPHPGDFILLQLPDCEVRIAVIDKVFPCEGLENIYMIEINYRSADVQFMEMVRKRLDTSKTKRLRKK